MTFLTTLTPLIDVITLRRSRLDGFNYGVPRGAGSAAFIVANLAMGAILAVTGSRRHRRLDRRWRRSGWRSSRPWSCRPIGSTRRGQARPGRTLEGPGRPAA